MKALIVTGIFPPDHGGPASYVPRIAAALGERAHPVLAVVTLSDSLDHDDSKYTFPVIRLRRAQPWWPRALQVVRIIRRLSRQADVVYLNGLVLEGIIACKWLGRRGVVVKVVGDLIWERARNQGAFAGSLDEFQLAGLSWRWRLLRKLQSWYTSQADAVICPSAYLGAIVSRWGVPTDRIRVVYNAVGGGQEPRFASPDYDLVTVARLVPWKGIADLIQVATELRLSLLIVGDGPLRAELELLALHSGAGAPISFAGHVDSARVEAEIRRGRVFVLNSSYEGLPHIVLEAKVAGVPVIATAAGGTPEVVGAPSAGVLVPVGDRAALALAVGALLADEAQQRRLVEASLAQVRERFSFASMVRETEQVLASCAHT